MKEIMAIIRIDNINRTKDALLAAGFPSITCRRVLGRGKKKVEFSLVKDTIYESTKSMPRLVEGLSEEHRLIPKRFLTLIVKDDEVQKVVEAIMKVNSTGNPGDGKIFVLPVIDVYRVRTGEVGEDAI